MYVSFGPRVLRVIDTLDHFYKQNINNDFFLNNLSVSVSLIVEKLK